MSDPKALYNKRLKRDMDAGALIDNAPYENMRAFFESVEKYS